MHIMLSLGVTAILRYIGPTGMHRQYRFRSFIPSLTFSTRVNVQPLLEGHPDPLWNAFRTRAAAHEWLTSIVQNMEGYGAFMAACAESPTGPSD